MTRATPESAAVAAVEAFERVALGDAFAAPRDAATRAVVELREAHHAKLFPRLEAVDLAVLLTCQHARDRFSIQQFADEMIRLHADAAAWPALQRHVRGYFGRRDVLEAALADAQRHGKNLEAHAAAEVRRFEDAIAAQLVDDREIGESARILAAVVPSLDARIAAAEGRHQAHIAAETARRAAEDQERTAALGGAEERRRNALAEWFGARPSRLFILRAWTVLGVDLAAIARRTAAYDRATGYLITGVTVEEMERLRAQTEAGDGAAA